MVFSAVPVQGPAYPVHTPLYTIMAFSASLCKVKHTHGKHRSRDRNSRGKKPKAYSPSCPSAATADTPVMIPSPVCRTTGFKTKLRPSFTYHHVSYNVFASLLEMALFLPYFLKYFMLIKKEH